MITAIKDPLFIIRIGIALIFIWFGIDKFINPFIWIAWVPKWILSVVPFSNFTFIYLQGVVQLLLGLLLLFGLFLRKAAVITTLFMIGIIIVVGFNDIAVRDFAILTIAVALILAKNHPLTLDEYLRKKK